MIDVDLPTTAGPDASVRGFAACLASVTETAVDDVPLPDVGLRQALGAWRTWLASRGSGLVPIDRPETFQWPGWWIGVVVAPSTDAHEEDVAPVLLFGTPAGVVLSPLRGDLVGRAATGLRFVEAYAVASLDPVIVPPSGLPELRGTIEAIAVAPVAEAPMHLLSLARLRAEHGIEGDRYATRAGTFGPRTRRLPGYDLTLIAAEVLEELAASGADIDFLRTRRNVLTRGLDVNQLVGRTFYLGDVLCAGRRLCEPCAHLERVDGPGLLRPLIHRGGVRVDVLGDGQITLGAAVRTV